MPRKLQKITEHQWAGGVCGGTAYWLHVPVWLVRIVWILVTLAFFFGFWLYVLLWVFMPPWKQMPEDYKEVTSW